MTPRAKRIAAKVAAVVAAVVVVLNVAAAVGSSVQLPAIAQAGIAAVLAALGGLEEYLRQPSATSAAAAVVGMARAVAQVWDWRTGQVLHVLPTGAPASAPPNVTATVAKVVNPSDGTVAHLNPQLPAEVTNP